MKSTLGFLLGLMVASGACVAGESEWLEPETQMPFVRIAKGCFLMGTNIKSSDPDEELTYDKLGRRSQAQEDEVPQHEVCLGGFWMGRYEVRVRDWSRIMGGAGSPDDVRPINNVTWALAREFAQRLSERTGERFRLPTEAEWEYACRAGAPADHVPLDREMIGIAWHSRHEARKTAPQEVGQLRVNGFGLYDMLGNVWEWVEDDYVANGYTRHGLHDPVVKEVVPQKVMRGASFRTEPRQTRCAVRGHLPNGKTMDSVGFRLVREAKE